MRKGPVFLGIGIFLILISIPTAMALTLYDSREVQKYDFVQEGEYNFYYEFKDLDPGTIKIEGRSMLFESTILTIRLEDGGGNIVFQDEMETGGIFGSEREFKLEKGGDYVIYIEVEDYPDSAEFTVTYNSRNSNFGLLTFIIGFPFFLISGLISLIIGIVLIVRFKRTGSEVSEHKKVEDLYYGNLEDYYNDVGQEEEFRYSRREKTVRPRYHEDLDDDDWLDEEEPEETKERKVKKGPTKVKKRKDVKKTKTSKKMKTGKDVVKRKKKGSKHKQRIPPSESHET